MSEKKKILIAEDDTNLGVLLCKFLKKEGYYTELYTDGEAANDAFNQNSFDLCLFDVMMPRLDGFSLLKKIRLRDRKTPILLITAKSLKIDKQEGYDLGADDFIVKPFDDEELLWKIKVFIKRAPEKIEKFGQPVCIGKYSFDFKNQALTLNGKSFKITWKECEVLNYLQEHRNNLIKREDILNELWGENDYFIGRSLDVFIAKLRRHLKEDSNISIDNVFGVGFIFNLKT